MAKIKAGDLFKRLANIDKKLDSKFEDTKEVEETKEEATEQEQKFAEVTLADGETVLSYDGELAAGTPIFVVGADGEQIPAPEGTHELGGDLQGVSIVVDAEGVITEVVDERDAQSSEESEEEMSSDDLSAVIAEAVNKALEPIVSQFAEIKKKNEEITKANEGFKAEIEKLKDSPSDKKEVKKKFSRDESLTPRQRMILANRNK